jgi:hypothetical protein
MSCSLLVGAYGWQHSNWVSDFYPEDMPEEWQLDFYANYFRTVLVPESLWTQWQQEDIEEVREAIELEEDEFSTEADCPAFQCYFEWSEAASSEKYLQHIERLQVIEQALGAYAVAAVLPQCVTNEDQLADYQSEVGLAFPLPLAVDAKLYTGRWKVDDLKGYVSMPTALTEGRAQADWLKEVVAKLASVPDCACTYGSVPLFIGEEAGKWQTPPSAKTVQEVKLLAEMLGA